MRKLFVVGFLLVATLLPSGTSIAAVNPDRAVLQGSITRLYTAYFKRAPDLGGLKYWMTRMQAGTPLSTASNAFSTSPEFVRTYGNLTDPAFVDLVYQNVLGRLPDAAGRAYWVGQLQARRTARGGVMIGFSESPEFVRKTGTTPPRPSFSFGDGDRDVPGGSYRNLTNAGDCAMARFGPYDEIVGLFGTDDTGRTIVTVLDSDSSFATDGCGTWVADIGPITLAPTEPFGEGTFRIGRDVASGRWQAPGGPDCYWQRLRSFQLNENDVMADGESISTFAVTIGATDVGFYSVGCGTWTKVG